MKLWINFEKDDTGAWGEGTFNEEPYLVLTKTAKLLKFTSKVITGKGAIMIQLAIGNLYFVHLIEVFGMKNTQVANITLLFIMKFKNTFIILL